MRIRIDLTGKRFGKLVAVKPVGSNKLGTIWLCKCDCGKETKTYASYLTSGHKTSCGCLRWTGKGVRKHGMSGTRQRTIYGNMKKRCDNSNCPDYKNYGGRGIKYCDKWKTFEGFWEDMQDTYSDNLTLDRIDVNGNYCKENCRWVTRKVHNNNTRANVCFEIDGENLTLSQIAEKYNLNYEKFRHRILDGWDLEKAIAFIQQRELITYNGVTKTVSELAKDYNMTYHQLKKRLMRGWSIEKALTQLLRICKT